MKTEIEYFIKTVNSLPYAFESAYWNMADTSYKEELCICFIEQNNIPINEAEKMLYKCGITKTKNPFVFLYLNKHLEQSMGTYTGITDFGKRKLYLLRRF